MAGREAGCYQDLQPILALSLDIAHLFLPPQHTVIYFLDTPTKLSISIDRSRDYELSILPTIEKKEYVSLLAVNPVFSS